MESLNIPDSTSTVQVCVIDTTCCLRNVPTTGFFGPSLKGFERFDVCAYAFLITHTDASTGKQRRVIFDLGPPKDWQNDLGKITVDRVKSWGCEIHISKYVSEVLEENHVLLDDIEAVIWSHVHWDHTGRVSLFPPNVELIADQDAISAFYPGYPTVTASAVLEEDFKGRKLRGVSFDDSSLVIGGFRAIDFCGDGSFYLLSAPGHAVGHIIGLARTTASTSKDSQSTFILMAADSFHHGSQLRPNHLTSLPESIPGYLAGIPEQQDVSTSALAVIHPSHPRRKAGIPEHYETEMQAYHGEFRTTPFLTVAWTEDGRSLVVDLAAAKQTIGLLQAFDADENVLLIAAHDSSLFDVLDLFPLAANDWKSKEWKKKGRWRFLSDLLRIVEDKAAEQA